MFIKIYIQSCPYYNLAGNMVLESKLPKQRPLSCSSVTLRWLGIIKCSPSLNFNSSMLLWNLEEGELETSVVLIVSVDVHIIPGLRTTFLFGGFDFHMLGRLPQPVSYELYPHASY